MDGEKPMKRPKPNPSLDHTPAEVWAVIMGHVNKMWKDQINLELRLARGCQRCGDEDDILIYCRSEEHTSELQSPK